MRFARRPEPEKQENEMRVLLAIDPSTGSQHVVDEAVARPWPTGMTICPQYCRHGTLGGNADAH